MYQFNSNVNISHNNESWYKHSISDYSKFFLAVSIEVPVSSKLLIGSDITVSCVVNITIEVTVAQVVWADQYFNLINTIDGNLTGSGMDDLILSIDLTINEVQVSNAGVYICEVIINDTLGDVATIQRQYTLTVKSKIIIDIFIRLLL